MNKVNILNYGLGNIHSLKNALNKINFEAEYLSKDTEIAPKILFIPGVGSYNKAMKLIKKKFPKILKLIKKKKIFTIGICLGMQLILKYGYEGGKNNGFGLLKGNVKLFSNKKIKLPNIGWKKIKFSKSINHNFLKKFNGKKFYFIHSYVLKDVNKKNIIATSKYLNYEFPAIVFSKSSIGIQFHPEKSGKVGLKLLSEILNNINLKYEK